MRRTPTISVVICSRNGATRIGRCLEALTGQTSPPLEIVVIDDGSTDGTADVARTYTGTVRRLAQGRGLAAARNAGIELAHGDVIAFTDDDCVPETRWLEELGAAYLRHPHVAGIGGHAEPTGADGPMLRYLQLSNPLAPLERDLDVSDGTAYRFVRYLVRNLRPIAPGAEREVSSLVGANMSFPADRLRALGGFDERFTFGGDEEELCGRVRGDPPAPLVFAPTARVRHEFNTDLTDTLRRSAAYGIGSARLARVRGGRPVVFPFPLLAAAALGASLVTRRHRLAAALLPLALYPRGPRAALSSGDWMHVVAPYVDLARETAGNLGVANGWYSTRRGGRP